ncbi:DNA mismatch repair protein msh3 [Thecamonas trahens ATCC 50062]|uniref:DNA mismatch repair protein msh3 n=1 Tax=Thecamonas trahens ATCC 50062 TaxID=461836 RepID=A0A0L0DQL9_THETB|nr:DNA mismatch repair protein msh3 [Thecamonas trahens ATCC 50062]KNC54582.1 DNA mismatch repair protein msh3 [Thecamonas trahens ATCC 50062]|eukprot:XP_013761491.1 DNA mismatch repair protein msh3 [Thecamonas trahens ATCC 50062]
MMRVGSGPALPAHTTRLVRRAGVKYTVLEAQVLEIKEKHPEILLCVQVGYKFRMFGEDAVAAARILSIVCYPKNNFANAAFPLTSLAVHVPRLVRAGHKVGIVRQTETAAVKKATASKGLMTRSLAEVFTISTLIDEAFAAQVSSTTEHASTPQARFVPGGGRFRKSSAGERSGAAVSDSGGPDAWRPTYLVSVWEESGEAGREPAIALAVVQPSTGEVLHESFAPDPLRTHLDAMLKRLQPSEYLLPPAGTLSKQTERIISSHVDAKRNTLTGVRTERLAMSAFEAATARKALVELGSSVLAVADESEALVRAFGAMADWLGQFKLAQVLGPRAQPARVLHATRMRLSASALANLDMVSVSSPLGLTGAGAFSSAKRRSDYGSLFWVLDRTQSAPGRRRLHSWMLAPLVDAKAIQERQAAVAYLAFESSGAEQLVKLLTALRTLPDLERAVGALVFGRLSPAQFVKVAEGMLVLMDALPAASALAGAPLLAKLTSSLPELAPVLRAKLGELLPAAAASGDMVRLFMSDAQFPELARARSAMARLRRELDEVHLPTARREVGLPALSYVSVSQEDYLLEVPVKAVDRVPMDWSLVSTTKKVKRYRPAAVSRAHQQLQVESELAEAAGRAAWAGWLKGIADMYSDLKAYVDVAATLDALHSLALLARTPGYTAPQLVEANADGAGILRATKARHPVLEQVMASSGAGEYVANSIGLDGPRTVVLTGPNMGGKSSLARSVALLAVMAQMGSYVPATEMVLTPFDAVYTRMGASDALFKGHSTFFVELLETANVLAEATPRSLVILDELGRGTSTHDGVAIAAAVLHHLVTVTQPVTLFITHYPQMAAFEAQFAEQVANYHMSFMKSRGGEGEGEGEDELVFLYQLVAGCADDSYGLNVARLAGIPADIRKRAAAKSAELALWDSLKTRDWLVRKLVTGGTGVRKVDIVHELEHWFGMRLQQAQAEAK